MSLLAQVFNNTSAVSKTSTQLQARHSLFSPMLKFIGRETPDNLPMGELLNSFKSKIIGLHKLSNSLNMQLKISSKPVLTTKWS